MAKKTIKEPDVKIVLQDQIIANVQSLTNFAQIQSKMRRRLGDIQSDITALQGANSALISTLATIRGVEPGVITEEIEAILNPEPTQPPVNEEIKE